MKIAVVGAGVSGLVAARELDREHNVHLFDAAPLPGGHAYTVMVEEERQTFPVDIGFIVYNERNYPNFKRLLADLNVETTPTAMGFSVSCPQSGFEYSGEGAAGMLARRRNLISPRFWRLVKGILRFHKAGNEELDSGRQRTLGEFCDANGLSQTVRQDYILPMAGAIWSTPRQQVLDFPAASLLNFFRHHGLLSLGDRPAWRTVVGGSRSYVDALVAKLRATLHMGASVEQVQFHNSGVALRVNGETVRFDEVVLATHSDQALRLLDTPTSQEREVLGAIRYRDNETVLHSDRSLLPRRRRAWSSWNVSLPTAESGIAITYWMNKLQPLPSEIPYSVTLNRTAEIDPNKIIHREVFAHPQFDSAAIAAQQRWAEISGARGVHFAGAYWRYGFHEDGTWSGLRAAESIQRLRRQIA